MRGCVHSSTFMCIDRAVCGKIEFLYQWSWEWIFEELALPFLFWSRTSCTCTWESRIVRMKRGFKGIFRDPILRNILSCEGDGGA